VRRGAIGFGAGAVADDVRAALLGEIPVLVPVEAKGKPVVGLTQGVQQPEHKVIQRNTSAARKIQIRGQTAAWPENHLAQERAAFEGEMVGQALSLKKLKQMREAHVDFDMGDVARTGKGGCLTKLLGR